MPSLSSAQIERIDALRVEVRALVPSGASTGAKRMPFDVEDLDARLSGGLARAALHEACAASTALTDESAATLFLAGIAARSSEGVVLWVMAKPDLFAPGLAQAGLPPSRLIQVDTRRDEDALAVIEEGLRHGGLSAVVGEITRVGMTATRRLQMAAEEGKTPALLLRRWKRQIRDPLTEPSAALTRWRIACAPSGVLPVQGVGRPRWKVSLVRQRGGEVHDWLLEGSDAQGRLAVPADSRDGSAAAVRHDERQAA